MKWKIVIFLSLILLFLLVNVKSPAQKYYVEPVKIEGLTAAQTGIEGALLPLGVIGPNRKTRAVFPVSGETLKSLKAKYKFMEQKAGIPFIKAASWPDFALVAKKSTEDLERALANLLQRINNLEERVKKLEGRK